ncbi:MULTISPECIES: hypothetical protein [Thalassospira]|nr:MULTISPECIES: hypothetical protein [Thalassospira]MBL4841349.1 hypothetical protein [Thalassospira sp.]MBR9781141.1 hypothetical protein [Rhodospirillales bacterium]MBR9816279.1 hypothetical protein [Rhodospirillales bacterium]MCD1596221.1 hypothetical protein [Thalassospira xiamenensis]QPL37080.1 hypothetical protein IT971_07205 [Thalassospira sp. B30-1]
MRHEGLDSRLRGNDGVVGRCGALGRAVLWCCAAWGGAVWRGMSGRMQE